MRKLVKELTAVELGRMDQQMLISNYLGLQGAYQDMAHELDKPEGPDEVGDKEVVIQRLQLTPTGPQLTKQTHCNVENLNFTPNHTIITSENGVTSVYPFNESLIRVQVGIGVNLGA